MPSDGELDKVLAPCLPITQRWLGRPLSPSSRFAEIDWVPVGTQWDRGVRTADCALQQRPVTPGGTSPRTVGDVRDQV